MLRAVTWNLHWWQRAPATPQLELIGRCTPDVVMLQEVSGPLVAELGAACRGDSCFSQQLHPQATAVDGLCGAAARRRRDQRVRVGRGAAKPQRGLWARVTQPAGEELLAVS